MLPNFIKVKLMNVITKLRKLFYVGLGFSFFFFFFSLYCISHFYFKRRAVAEIRSYYGINNKFGFFCGFRIEEGYTKKS